MAGWVARVTLGITLVGSLTPVLGQRYSPPAREGMNGDTELASLLRNTPMQQQEILSQALRIVHSMESAPTCNRLAALNLINDCKSLEQSSGDGRPNTEMVLDEIKSEYAARLAICELVGAKATVPRECIILVPSTQACVKSRFMSFFSRQDSSKEDYCYPEATRSQFERCLRALEARPQSWTSYSNARQNAVVMCHASRDSVEKEKSLSTYKSLTEVVSHMATMLSHSLKEMQAWATQQLEFAEKVKSTQSQALTEMELNREASHSAFNSVFSALQSLTGRISQEAKSLSETLELTLENSRASIVEVRGGIQDIKQGVVQAAEIAINQKHEIQSNHENALLSLQLNHQAAVYSVNALSNAIVTLQDQVNLSSGEVENLNKGLKTLNKTVEDLGAATETLRTTIDTVATLSGLVANSRFWIAITISLGGLWMANRMLTGYIIAALGLTVFLSAIDFQQCSQLLIHSTEFIWLCASEYSTLAIAMGLFVIVLISVGLSSYANSVYIYAYTDEKGEKGLLPNIETPSPPATPLRARRDSILSFTCWQKST